MRVVPEQSEPLKWEASKECVCAHVGSLDLLKMEEIRINGQLDKIHIKGNVPILRNYKEILLSQIF